MAFYTVNKSGASSVLPGLALTAPKIPPCPFAPAGTVFVSLVATGWYLWRAISAGDAVVRRRDRRFEELVHWYELQGYSRLDAIRFAHANTKIAPLPRRLDPLTTAAGRPRGGGSRPARYAPGIARAGDHKEVFTAPRLGRGVVPMRIVPASSYNAWLDSLRKVERRRHSANSGDTILNN